MIDDRNAQLVSYFNIHTSRGGHLAPGFDKYLAVLGEDFLGAYRDIRIGAVAVPVIVCTAITFAALILACTLPLADSQFPGSTLVGTIDVTYIATAEDIAIA